MLNKAVVVLRAELYRTYKLSGSYSGHCLCEKSLLGSYSSLDNKFALEELAAFIFRASEVQVAAASASYSA